MANIVLLCGRLTGDPVTKPAGTTTITRASIAVERAVKKDGQPTADFINLILFGKMGDNFTKFFHKGSPVLVTGEWRTGNYTNKDGQKVYTNDCLVSHWEFLPKDKGTGTAPAGNPADAYANAVTGLDEEQPFT